MGGLWAWAEDVAPRSSHTREVMHEALERLFCKKILFGSPSHMVLMEVYAMQGPEPEDQSPRPALLQVKCVTRGWPPPTEVQEASVAKWRGPG